MIKAKTKYPVLARDRGINIGKYFNYALLMIFALVFIFPLYLSIVNSLNSLYAVPTILPLSFHIENYVLAMTLISFWKYAGNSVILAVISVATYTLSSGLAGYAFARFKAPGKGLLFMIILSTMMLPGIVTQIPTFVLFRKIGLLDSFIPWILWGIGGSPFNIFLFRQFFQTIPVELEDAARIDGCSIFRTYWNIFLPISLPVVATVTILTFYGSWNDVVGPFMYLSQNKYPLATALAMIGYLQNGSQQQIPQVSIAGGLILAIPVIITFAFGQKYIVQGIVTTGLKG